MATNDEPVLGRGLEALIPSQKPGGQQLNVGQDPAQGGGGPVQLPVAQPVQREELPTPEASQRLEQPAPQKKEMGTVFHIEVERIRPNPDQPRRDFDEESLKELAASIREFGLLQPIVVTKVEEEVLTGTAVHYQLIAGERRWLAAKMLGLPTVPAVVRNLTYSRESLELAVIENIQRENLNPIETGRAFARLQDEFRMTQREIASRLGKSREAVANTMRLLDLPSEIQSALEGGKISESHGRLLLTIDDPALQMQIFRDLTEHRLTTRELKRRVEGTTGEKRKERAEEQPHPLSPELVLLEERLSAELGTPVTIRAHGEGGKITIAFYSSEELQGIVKKFGSGEE